MGCIICGENEFDTIKNSVRDRPNLTIVKCTKCGHYQLYLLPRFDELKNYYDEDRQVKSIYSRIDDIEVRRRTAQDTIRRCDLVKEIIKDQTSKRILDIGAGYGFFIEMMERWGYQIEGIEIGLARRQRAQVICKSKIYPYDLLSEIPKHMIGKYDVIVLFQVLEHIVDPNRFLRNIKTIMKRNATIIIEVPNVDDHLLKASSEYNSFFWQEAHISYFSPDTLNRILTQCCFSDIKISGLQRYSLENNMNWIINRKPQLKEPSYKIQDELKWLDDYYKDRLSHNLSSDTIIAVAKT